MLSLKREIEGMVLQDQTSAVKETTVNNRDSRSHNICVSSDKLGFLCLSVIFSFFESYALFSNKMKMLSTETVPLNSPSWKNNFSVLGMPMFIVSNENWPFDNLSEGWFQMQMKTGLST